MSDDGYRDAAAEAARVIRAQEQIEAAERSTSEWAGGDATRAQERALSGCSLKALGWAAVVAIAIIVFIVILATRGSDGDDRATTGTAPAAVTTMPAPPSTTVAAVVPVTTEPRCVQGGGAVRAPCPETTVAAATTVPDPATTEPVSTDAPASTIDAGTETTVDLSTFAGRYVMTSGLDDPTSLDATSTNYEPARVTVFPSQGEIVIGADGTIIDGLYVTHVQVENSCGVGRESVQFDYSTSFDTASGTVTETGKGQVQFHGTLTSTNCVETATVDGGSPIMEFWIAGEDMILCRGLATSPTTCNFRTTATLRRVTPG